MKRTSLWAAGLLVFSASSFAQQPAQQPDPQLPASVLGSQLVAWSELQKPRPVLQPLSPPQPDPSAQQQPQQSADSQGQQQPSSQAFTGAIVKDGSKYVLKASDSALNQVDDQEKAKLFERRQVKEESPLTHP